MVFGPSEEEYYLGVAPPKGVDGNTGISDAGLDAWLDAQLDAGHFMTDFWVRDLS